MALPKRICRKLYRAASLRSRMRFQGRSKFAGEVGKPPLYADATGKPRPGEPIDITITTCDAAGKPVASRSRLVRTDERSHFGQSGAARHHCRDLPWGAATTREFRTASSIGFHYRPLLRVTAADASDATKATIPPGISPQIGVNVRPPQPAPKEMAGDDPFGDVPSSGETRKPVVPLDNAEADEEFSRKADFAALKAEIERTDNARSNDDPFGARGQPAVSKAADASMPAKARSAPDRFGPDSDDAVENPASHAPLKAKGGLDTNAVTRFARPAWPGYWNPSIVTGPDGRATITVAPPNDAADLTIAAQAVAAGNLAGQTAKAAAMEGSPQPRSSCRRPSLTATRWKYPSSFRIMRSTRDRSRLTS